MSDAGKSTFDLAHARVGTTLRNKWRLDKLLGVGGMAAVYLGTHRNGARGAIKVLHLAVSLNAEAQQRFLREGYAANAVGHPGAVQVLDDDVAEDGSAFLVMELLEGESLESMSERRGGKLPPAEVLSLADRLLDVVGAAHQKGIVHRDIKPDNVFLTRDGTLKLLDFGIARLRDGSGSVALTTDGTAFGTPAFMAPEQALGRTDLIDGRTDLFSIGATMFSLLTGRLVHVTQTINEQLVAQASRPPPSLAAVAPDMPAPVVAVVDRALAFEKTARWPDARIMRDEIRAAAAALAAGHVAPAPRVAAAPPVAGAAPPFAAPVGGHVTVAPSVRDTRRPSSGSGSVLAGVVAGALCVLGAVVVLLRHFGAPAPAPTTTAPAATVTAATATAEASSLPAPPPPATASEPLATPSASVSAAPPVPTASASASPLQRPPHTTATPKKPPAKPGGDSWLDRQH